MTYYQGCASQRGRGLGNIMGGLFRAAVPWIGSTLKKAAKAAGTSLMSSGLNALDNKRARHEPAPVIRHQNVNRATSRKRKRGTQTKPRKRRKAPRLLNLKGEGEDQDILNTSVDVSTIN